MAKEQKLSPFPRILVRSLIALVTTRRFSGLTGALRVAANCCRDGQLDEPDVQL